jgi:ribonuclease VapC
MVLDSSALVAILMQEPEAASLANAIASNSPVFLSAASLLEVSMVIDTRKGDDGARDLDLLIYRSGFEIVPVDKAQVEIARVAWRKYGKGRHRAALNYGDCFSYALAKAKGAPLLYKGNHFAATDLPKNPMIL